MAKKTVTPKMPNKADKPRSNMIPRYDQDQTTILNKRIQRHPMDPGLKVIWLEALRSEAFGQAQGELVIPADSCFCCLGVLGCVIYPGAFELNLLPGGGTGYPIQSVDAYGDTQELLNRLMLQAVGLTPGQQSQLAFFNDDGATFEEIANWVERNL